MRILHVIPSLKKGGAERLVLDIIHQLQYTEGVEAKLITFRSDNDYEYLSDKISHEVVPAEYIPSLTKKSKKNLDNYNRFVQFFKPDVIHSHLLESELITRHVILDRVKYFTHLHDNMPQFRNLNFTSFFNKKLLTNFYEKRLLINQYAKCKNQFIAISQDTESYFRRTLPGNLKQNIHLLHNAIDHSRFVSPDTRKGIDKKLKIISVGSLVNKKNQSFLVEVGKGLKDNQIDFEINILGEGANRNKIQELISIYNLSDNVFLRGNVDNVEEWLWLSDVFIHTATYEPFGLVLLEAMSAGLPVIALDGRGNRDVMLNGKNGYLVKSQDAAEFVRLINLFRESPDHYHEVSNFAINFAKNFDIQIYTKRLLNLYRQDLKI